MSDERYIEQRLRTEVKKLHGLCVKFVSPGMNGVPDRIILLPGGRIYFVELKSSTGKLSPVQLSVHALFKICGFPVRVFSNINHVLDFIESVRTS